MKLKIILLIVLISLKLPSAFSQQYYAFPTDTAHWSTLLWFNNGSAEWVNNYQYII